MSFFSPSEFHCKCSNRTCIGKTTAISPVLLQVLEDIRSAFKAPIIVTSGWRCPAHNKTVGGALRSQHVQGMAVDIRPRDLKDLPQLRELCRADVRLIGIGVHDAFVHIDVRKGRRVEWKY